MDNPTLQSAIEQCLKSAELEFTEFAGELMLRVPAETIVEACTQLRDAADLRFNYLSDMTALDFLNQGREPRFDVVYHLYSVEHHHRLRVKAGVAEDNARISSVVEVWAGADKAEREAFDMYGIEFEGHPDLRRILMPDDWEGHPLRKDFPLGGGKSFYLKRDSEQYAGEPSDLVPRIRIQDGEV
jgi:NADH-quinone oxidoreductase subunit C